MPKNISAEQVPSPQRNSDSFVKKEAPASKNTLTNGQSNVDITNTDADVHSFLEKLDMQITAGKKAVCTIISEPK